MPSDVGKRGNRFSDHRVILEGIAWRFRTGSPWRDLPADFGHWKTVWKRHHRCSLDGTYDEMFARVAAVFGLGVEMAGAVVCHEHGTGLNRFCQGDGTTWIASYGTTGAPRRWSFRLSVRSP